MLAVALPSAGSAQAPAPCTPAQTASVEITTRDTVQDGTDNPLYATHEVEFSTEVNADAHICHDEPGSLGVGGERLPGLRRQELPALNCQDRG